MRRLILLAALASLATQSQAQSYRSLEPRIRPLPRLETIPPSPGQSYEWVHGSWKWNGYAFRWIRGKYQQRRPPSFRWVKGHWEGSPTNARFVPGYFAGPGRKQP